MSKRYFQLFFFVLPILFLQAYPASGQLMIENFDYSTGQLTDNVGGANVSGGNWVDFSGGGFFIQVTNGSLTYSGYPASAIGNKIEITNPTGSAEDAYREFPAQAPDVIVYTSFLLNLPNTNGLCADTSTNGDYFVALLPSTSTSNYVARLIIKDGSAADTYWLGLRVSTSNTSEWRPINLNAGTTYLVVLGYNIISGNGNDVVKLWVNPVLTGSEPAADITQTSALTTDPADIARFAVRQGYVAVGDGTPNAAIDGIMISNAWADIGGTIFSVQSVAPSNGASGVGQKPVISATFNSLVDAATVNAASFLVSGRKVANYTADSIRPLTNSNTFYFYPHDSLALGDTITATLTFAITDTGGRTLSSNYTWTFYVVVPETIRPRLLFSIPGDQQTNIMVDAPVELVFSEALNPATIDTAAFSVTGHKQANYSIAVPVLSDGNTKVTLNLLDELSYADTITVTIKSQIVDIQGNQLNDTSIVFYSRVNSGITIFDIQYTTDPAGNSSYIGQTVTVTGVVTGVTQHCKYPGCYFIQDGYGPWNGIYCFDPSRFPSLGDSVKVTGLIKEFYTTTELEVKSYEVLKKGCRLPAPVILPTDSLISHNNGVEAYEGVLVATNKVNVRTAPNGYFEWAISDLMLPLTTDSCLVDDFIDSLTYLGYTPVAGDSLVSVRGIIQQTYGYKIEPRSAKDIIQFKPVRLLSSLPSQGDVNVPTQVGIYLEFDKPLDMATLITANFSITGSQSSAHSFSVTYDSLNYEVKLKPSMAFQPGETVAVWISHSIKDTLGFYFDGNGNGIGSNDYADDLQFQFTVLLNATPISEVQRPGADGFTPALVGTTVMVEGIVSGQDGIFTSSTSSTASWYLQDNTGGVNIYGGTKGEFDIGRRVVVTGTVTEYNGVTEIASVASIDAWDYADEPVNPKALIYNQLLGESIEGLLASVEGTISSVPAYAGGGYNMELRNGNAPIAVRFGDDDGFDRSQLTFGQKVRVTGIVSQYDTEAPYTSGYQLVPRFPDSHLYNGILYSPDIELLSDSVSAAAAAEIVSIKPNPFSLDLGEVVEIEINSPITDHITLRIYDLKGRLIKTIFNNVPGGHKTLLDGSCWDGTDDSSRRANIGMYIAHMRSVTAEGAISDKTKIIVLGTPLK